MNAQRQKLEMLEEGIIGQQVDHAWDYLKTFMDEGAQVRQEMLTRALILIVRDLYPDKDLA